ncbi:MAG: hypothetical protein IPK85_00095 [Gemmatimonadetes bacterium]|nr:hypothetical protein [Gemmatimonadota bacterium]
MKTGEYGKVPIDPERPWPGLLSFPEAAARLFHGRSVEVAELLRLVESEPIAFLYGKSGLSKTSLLQAGLFPQLRERDRLPVYVRLSHAEGAPSATAQIFAAITAAPEPPPLMALVQRARTRCGGICTDATWSGGVLATIRSGWCWSLTSSKRSSLSDNQAPRSARVRSRRSRCCGG